MKWSTIITSLLAFGAIVNAYRNNPSSDDPIPASFVTLYVRDMKCNDAGTHCQECYIGDTEGHVPHLNIFEFTRDPAKYKFKCVEGNQDWEISIMQADLTQPYRTCVAWNNYTMDAQLARIDLCLDNTFKGVEVPPECPQPLFVVSLEYREADKLIAVPQNLLCASP